MGRLKRLDPAEKILKLKVCDPAMGSGHFLVNLVDHLSDRVIAAMAEAEAAWEGYLSPLNERIENIRNTIIDNAERRGWTVDPSQLDDRHIVRRMVLKRCVYGVDKNPMAVELAKVSLWLHTFTVGAPLSFLDHHLRCGDSLFGAWVKPSLDKAEQHGGPVFLRAPLARATRAAAPDADHRGIDRRRGRRGPPFRGRVRRSLGNDGAAECLSVPVSGPSSGWTFATTMTARRFSSTSTGSMAIRSQSRLERPI